MSKSLLRKTDPLEPEDRDLLRSLSGAGMPLRPSELAGDDDLGMDTAEVEARLERLVAAGYAEPESDYVTATVEGSALLVRGQSDLSGR